MTTFAQRVKPKRLNDGLIAHAVCAIIPVLNLETLASLVAAGRREEALRMIQGMRYGARRLERVAP